MEGLDLLKKHWKDSDKNMPKYSYEQLYAMILKKSSSIVKWIFIISLIEFAIWGFLYFILPKQGMYDDFMGSRFAKITTSLISSLGFVFFIVIFYINYHRIQVTDSVKELMSRILITRKSVTYFILFNIGGILIYSSYTLYNMIHNKEGLTRHLLTTSPNIGEGMIPELLKIFYITYSLSILVFAALLFILYRIVYIRLLKRLKSNYKELQEIDLG